MFLTFTGYFYSGKSYIKSSFNKYNSYVLDNGEFFNQNGYFYSQNIYDFFTLFIYDLILQMNTRNLQTNLEKDIIFNNFIGKNRDIRDFYLIAKSANLFDIIEFADIDVENVNIIISKIAEYCGVDEIYIKELVFKNNIFITNDNIKPLTKDLIDYVRLDELNQKRLQGKLIFNSVKLIKEMLNRNFNVIQYVYSYKEYEIIKKNFENNKHTHVIMDTNLISNLINPAELDKIHALNSKYFQEKIQFFNDEANFKIVNNFTPATELINKFACIINER